MDNGIISVYAYDLIFVLDHIINWVFRFGLLYFGYKLIDYLEWRD